MWPLYLSWDGKVWRCFRCIDGAPLRWKKKVQPDWPGQSDDTPPLSSPPPTAHPEPGRPAAGTLGAEGCHSDGGQLRHLSGAAVRSHDRKLHLLGSGQPIRIQEVSPAHWFSGSRRGR